MSFQAQKGSDMRQQFTLIHGLAQETICSGLNPTNSVLPACKSRNQHHRRKPRFWIAFQAAAYLEAIQEGHIHVEQYQIRFEPRELLKRTAAVGCGHDSSPSATRDSCSSSRLAASSSTTRI